MAISAVKIGVAPLSIPAIAESIHCWAMGNRVNGIATHTAASNAIRGQSARSIFRDLAAGTRAITAAPNATRSIVTTPGWNESRPTAISRNEEPQIRASEMNRPQSWAENASRLVP